VRAKYWMHGGTPDVEDETRRPYWLYTADATSYHKSGLRYLQVRGWVRVIDDRRTIGDHVATVRHEKHRDDPDSTNAKDAFTGVN
jgi:hypothetical protein